jgi:predicted 3-demethylubiquinone-9 3-methyltransferase (glyoxalase superfamily)
MFKFNEAVSFQVHCDTQDEIDHYWERLGAGGDPKAQQCGWLKDRYGVSWQIVPAVLPKLLADPGRAQRVLAALMAMTKLDVRALEAAARAK